MDQKGLPIIAAWRLRTGKPEESRLVPTWTVFRYLSDALRDFVDAVQSLFSAETAKCVWEEEPGQFCWNFRRAGLRCLVEVFQNKNNEEQAIFSADDDLLHFSSEVESALQKLLNEWGEDRYFKQWGYAFPKEAHQKLSQAIKAELSQKY